MTELPMILSKGRLGSIFRYSSNPSYLTNYFRKVSILQRNTSWSYDHNYAIYPILSRGIATQPPFIHLPPPPPLELDADGKPRKYRLNQKFYNHKYDWERWTLRPAGVFHTVYYGEFAQELGPIKAWLLQFPICIAFIPYFIACASTVFLINTISTWGIKPKRYTIEWMEASKERDRAENTNPVTRYLDRRRKERGPNWLMERYLPTHPFFMNMSSSPIKEQAGKAD